MPVIFNLELQKDTQISVPRYNQLYKAERAIKKGLVFQISDDEKQYEISNAPALTDQGFSIFSDVEDLIETYNKKNNITIAVEEDENRPPATVVGTISPDASSIEAHIRLYQQSTQAQKKAFRLWLLEQDMK